LQQGLELAFDFVAGQRGVAAEQAEAWPLRASRRSLGASMGNIPENNGRQCITQRL
jgi:hypothetical protein